MQTQRVTAGGVLAVRYSLGGMAPATASRRFRLRVLELMEERHITQKALKGNNTEGWISNKIHGRRGVQLDEAEEIAGALQVPLAELIRRPDDQHYTLDNLESRLVEAFRQFSKDEQSALLILATLRQRQAPHGTGRQFATGRSSPPGSPGGAHGRLSTSRATPTALSNALRRLVDEFDPESPVALGRQDATSGADRAELPHRPGKARRSHTPTK